MTADIALLRYTTRNLGDDIQTFAVRQFINVNQTIDRDRMEEEPELQELVLFGWLLQSQQWPPKANRVHPLSVHVADVSRSLMAKHVDWWKCLHATIPCRDTSSAEFFLRLGVSAVFEGCSTLSLKRWVPPRTGTVLIVDASTNPSALPGLSFPDVQSRTHKISYAFQANQEFRRQSALEALVAYQQAELVITSRLHVMLPCLAFGTPVVFIKDDRFYRAGNYTRLLDYLPYVEVWDGRKTYSTEDQGPLNFRPEAIIFAVTQRLQTLAQTLGIAPRG